MKSIKGFTLIELVVTIGLIVILFSMSISSSINNLDKELKVIESQIETSLYKALTWSKSNREPSLVIIDNEKIKVSTVSGHELGSELIGENHIITFINSLDTNKVEVSEKGFLKRNDLEYPVEVSINSLKENKVYVYDISMSGRLMKKE